MSLLRLSSILLAVRRQLVDALKGFFAFGKQNELSLPRGRLILFLLLPAVHDQGIRRTR
jgi:hypothetical protein